MPYYDFSCRDCSTITSIKASIEEKETGLLVRCESCGSTETEQAFLNVAIAGSRSSEMRSAPCGTACGCFPGSN